jgi:hypothetical protein
MQPTQRDFCLMLWLIAAAETFGRTELRIETPALSRKTGDEAHRNEKRFEAVG